MKKSNSNRRIFTILLSVVLVVSVILAILSQFNSISKAQSDRQLQTLLNDLQSGTYDLMVVTQSAAVGDRVAYDQLPQIDSLLQQAGQQFNVGATELSIAEMDQFNDQLSRLRNGINSMLLQRESVLFLYDQGALLEQNIPQIQQAYNTVTDVMLRSGTPSAQVAESQAQVWRAETMLGGLRQILAGSENSVQDAENFRQNVLFFSNVLNGMLQGDRLLGIDRVGSADARASLQQVQTQFSETDQSVQLVLDATPALTSAREAAEQILATAPQFLNKLTELSDSISALAGNRAFSSQWALYAVAMAIAAVFGLGILVYLGTKSNLRVTEETNEKNQKAILRLLDEITDLGEGDLTVKATVSEDFTGAIADSINFAVDQLRGLVSQVVDTAETVVSSSNRTRSTSLELAEAAEHQAGEITKATTSIKDIAESIRQVSENATDSATEAERSVEIASKGSAVVRNTITGMDGIREQIQDTSKRIKRLGESSQEIGEIVSLIDEIADQTNILALNASIQAAMAGESGRGFAVVADEVQRLAERAAASTKQIESLVKTIQSDTNEAVASMEQTTAEVVRGAQLANDAGDALDEIETGSNNLAQLILEISKAAQEQSEQADGIANSMNVIQDISGQTLRGTSETADSVGELVEQASRLKDSVTDFKLPSSVPDEEYEADGFQASDDQADVDDVLRFEETEDEMDESTSEPKPVQDDNDPDEDDDLLADAGLDFDSDKLKEDIAALDSNEEDNQEEDEKVRA